MKRPIILVICSVFLTFTIFMAPAIAGQEGAGHGGLFGNIRLGGGVVSGNPSGLEVLDDNDILDLNSRGSRRSKAVILLGAGLGYTFKMTGSTLLAAMDTEGHFSLSLSQGIEKVGALTLSALYENQEVWQNPYLVGVSRIRTDAESIGFAINWDHILGTGAWLVYEQMQIDIVDDLIGQVEPELRRDGKDTTLGLGYSLDLAAGGVLIPSLSHIWIDREGAANSGSSYVAELKYVLGVGRLIIDTSFEWNYTGFEGEHPIFHKKREETTYGISEIISHPEPFGLKNWSLFGIAAIRKIDSNITFFDSSLLLLGAGIGYNF